MARGAQRIRKTQLLDGHAAANAYAGVLLKMREHVITRLRTIFANNRLVAARKERFGSGFEHIKHVLHLHDPHYSTFFKTFN